jgi:two-component system, OmpR family, response regulator
LIFKEQAVAHPERSPAANSPNSASLEGHGFVVLGAGQGIGREAFAVSCKQSLDADMANPPSADPQQSRDDRQTVLVVDDDPALQTMIFDYFVENKIRTLLASGRDEMLLQLSGHEVSIVILDLRLGRVDGLDVLRELRSDYNVPVIILTGYRRDAIDRVIGLELGADAYVTKPFNLRELLARVRGIIRRIHGARPSPRRALERGSYRFSGWRLNTRTRRLTDPTGADVTLTKGEYTVLVTFLNAPQRPLSREHLMQATRVHKDVFDRSIDVQILRLRRKLERDPSAPQIIQTERGVGYLFAQHVDRY